MDDFSKYQAMKDVGATPAEVYSAAKHDQIDKVAMFRLLRGIFGLSLVEAKELMIVADGKAASLEEYQEKLLPAVEEALRQIQEQEDS